MIVFMKVLDLILCLSKCNKIIFRMLIFIEKQTGRISLYGSLKILFENEKNLVVISLAYFYNTVKIEDADWENDKCKICKRSVIRAKHGQFL